MAMASIVKLGTPLPGYTGTTRKVVAANIFGQTFANSLKTADELQKQGEKERLENFKTQSGFVPNLRK